MKIWHFWCSEIASDAIRGVKKHYLQHLYIPVSGKLGKVCLIDCWVGLRFETIRLP